MKRVTVLVFAVFVLAIAQFSEGSSWTKQSGGSGGVAVGGAITGSVANCVLHTNADGATLGCEAGFEYDPATNILTVPAIIANSYTDGSADPADTGVLRCGNNVPCISAEASPAGTDETILLDTAERWRFSGQLSLIGGTAASPSIIFNHSNGYGLYSLATSIGVATGSTRKFLFGATNISDSPLSVKVLQDANTKTLTESTETAFVQVSVASDSFVGGSIEYTIHGNDAADQQAISGILPFVAINDAGTEVCTIGTVGAATEVVAVSSGTLTNTFTCTTTPADGILLNANAVSSLTQTTLAIKYRVIISSGTATVTAQ